MGTSRSCSRLKFMCDGQGAWTPSTVMGPDDEATTTPFSSIGPVTPSVGMIVESGRFGVNNIVSERPATDHQPASAKARLTQLLDSSTTTTSGFTALTQRMSLSLPLRPLQALNWTTLK